MKKKLNNISGFGMINLVISLAIFAIGMAANGYLISSIYKRFRFATASENMIWVAEELKIVAQGQLSRYLRSNTASTNSQITSCPVRPIDLNQNLVENGIKIQPLTTADLALFTTLDPQNPFLCTAADPAMTNVSVGFDPNRAQFGYCAKIAITDVTKPMASKIRNLIGQDKPILVWFRYAVKSVKNNSFKTCNSLIGATAATNKELINELDYRVYWPGTGSGNEGFYRKQSGVFITEGA